MWDWYSYIDVSASELALAVRAVNVFFSLWVMQLVHPQGSASAVLQYGMLASFVLVLACYSASLALVLLDKSPH